MSLHRTFLAAMLGFVAATLGCSSQPEPAQKPIAAKKEPQPTQFETGRSAFQKLYIAARNWSIDAKPIGIESRPRTEDKPDGTASVWSGQFAAPSKQSTRSFVWSGAEAQDAPEPGVSPG